MKNAELNLIVAAIGRELHAYSVLPLDIAAACAYMALTQAAVLGSKVNKGELKAEDVPTRAVSELMQLLKEDASTLAMVRQIATALQGVASALNKTTTYTETRGIVRLNVGTVEEPKQKEFARKVDESIGGGVFPAAAGDEDTVRKTDLAAAWFWLFQQYQLAGERLNCTEAQLDHYKDVPDRVSACLKAVLAATKQ
ncbi:MAG: hypothetical protein Greene041619_187 [Candidatus Peregrinibacteria bacterium Greene0416_19]|nr:MAG: hypothetical protein Greene041619_187 [Candidatus Peregrinibacteria bacterium Greene0416_19]